MSRTLFGVVGGGSGGEEQPEDDGGDLRGRRRWRCRRGARGAAGRGGLCDGRRAHRVGGVLADDGGDVGGVGRPLGVEEQLDALDRAEEARVLQRVAAVVVGVGAVLEQQPHERRRRLRLLAARAQRGVERVELAVAARRAAAAALGDVRVGAVLEQQPHAADVRLEQRDPEQAEAVLVDLGHERRLPPDDPRRRLVLAVEARLAQRVVVALRRVREQLQLERASLRLLVLDAGALLRGRLFGGLARLFASWCRVRHRGRRTVVRGGGRQKRRNCANRCCRQLGAVEGPRRFT